MAVALTGSNSTLKSYNSNKVIYYIYLYSSWPWQEFKGSKKELETTEMTGLNNAYMIFFDGVGNFKLHEYVLALGSLFFENIFIKAGDSETEKILQEKKQSERDQAGMLWLSRNVTRKKWANAQLLSAHWRLREKETASGG